MIGWKLFYCGQNWMCLLTVSVCQDGLPARQHGPPEGEAPVVVDGVICLSQQYEVRHGGVHSHAGQAREDDPLVEEVLTAPVQVVTGHQEQAVRVLRQEVLYAVKEELAADLLALVPVLDPVDVVRPPDVETETWSVTSLCMAVTDSPHKGCLPARLGLEPPQILLDSLHHVGPQQGEEHLPHLADVLHHQLRVEPLEHHVGLVGRVGQELPRGDLGPLIACRTQAVRAVGTDTGLQWKVLTELTSLLHLTSLQSMEGAGNDDKN